MECFLSGKKKTVVVIGVERGGTSMVAGVLRALGVFMGARTGRNHENPSFQHERLQDLQREIKFLNTQHDTWGFKYPRASLMLDFYSEHLRNPVFILVTRNIASVVDSWCARGTNDPIDTALHAIEYYNSALGAMREKQCPAIVVNYEQACRSPVAFIKTLINFLEIEVPMKNLREANEMVTGDGGGYVNIPEHNFFVEPVPSLIEPLCCVSVSSEQVWFEGKVGESDVNVSGCAYAPKHESSFPKEIWIKVQKDSAEEMDGVRLYVDFGGGFFSRHSYEVRLDRGENNFRLVFNNDVVSLCFAGPNFHQDSVKVPAFYSKGEAIC